MINYPALKTELNTDPLGVGYVTSLNTGNLNAVAALLNSSTGKGAATIQLTGLAHDDFAQLVAPVVMNMSGASAALQAKWGPMLQLIGGIQTVQLNAQNLGMLSMLSNDFPTIFTSAMITSATTRTGSRAEVLFGIGTTISWTDVVVAEGL